jgi:hypothetical protein
MDLYIYYSPTSPFIPSNGLPTRSNKLGASPGHISYAISYLFYSENVPFFLESFLQLLFRIKDPTTYSLLDNKPDTFDRV